MGGCVQGEGGEKVRESSRMSSTIISASAWSGDAAPLDAADQLVHAHPAAGGAVGLIGIENYNSPRSYFSPRDVHRASSPPSYRGSSSRLRSVG